MGLLRQTRGHRAIYYTYLTRLFPALVFLMLALPLAADTQQVVWLGQFSTGKRDGWQDKRFQGSTQYKFEQVGGVTALRADSQAAASGLYRKQHVDLRQTPVLQWRWRVEHLPGQLAEQTREGDDYVARIYVVVSGGIWFWRTRAINYVWSSGQPVGSHWPNAFTANAHMVAVVSGDQGLGQWMTLQRNVREDFKRYFDMDIEAVDAVAIMTDMDNSGGQATAYYGDIQFIEK